MNYFLNRYKRWGHDIIPEEIELKKAIRINTQKIDEKKLLERLRDKGVKLTKIPFLKNGYFFEADFAPASTPEYLFGYYYIQEPASQKASEILDPKEDELVLDMCAAPGSKTTHISQLMKNKGTIITLDNNLARIKSLKNNIERMGCENTIVYKKDAKYADDITEELNKRFDRILLDAPCSGNFTTDEDWFKKRETTDTEEIIKEQKNLIATAISCLKEEGILVYSTCSLEKEENEDIIEYALHNFDVELEKIEVRGTEKGLTEKTTLCRRFWPDKTPTQGFFIAKLRKIQKL